MQGKLSEAVATLGHPGPSGAPLLHLTVVQQDAHYRPRAVQTEYYLGEDEDDKGAPALPVHTTLVRSDTGLYHVALQWEQYAAQIKGSDSVAVTKGTPLRTATERIASLTALSNAEDKLEMSDVVPVAAEALMSLTRHEEEHPHLQPYPFSALAEQDSPGLYFEIYHLTFGADDQTHYAVEYEMVQRKARGGVLRFRKQEVRTATQTSYTGTTRTAREAILLTLEEWVDGELEVIVCVTDEITGQQVERSVLFETIKRNN